MARGIRDDKLAMIRAEKTVGHIDGNALFALGGEAVYQQGKINIAALRAQLFGIFEQGGDLILKHQLGFIQHAPNQGAFAVVHAAAGNKAQEIERVLLRKIGVHLRGGCKVLSAHQKYPSCFFFSIEPEESESMALPWRSLVRELSSSSTIEDKSSAFDSTAPVSG